MSKKSMIASLDEGRSSMLRLVIGVLIPLFLTVGCASFPSLNFKSPPLQLDVTPSATQGEAAYPVRDILIKVKKYDLAGPVAISGKVGNITSAVNDMLGTELYVDDVAGTVTTAIANQLAAHGFKVATGEHTATADGGDFEIFGIIREFSMNVAGRDEIVIEIETSLRDVRKNTILWSGVVKEKSNRFAGVTGNTRHSVTEYLSSALSKVSTKTSDAVSESMMHTYPELFQRPVLTSQSTPGIKVLIAPSPQALPARPKGAGMPGRVTIITTPTRAKVYVADVYYGLAPLNFELAVGIRSFEFRLDGFQTAVEKVSVRPNETTEIEMTLHREAPAH